MEAHHESDVVTDALVNLEADELDRLIHTYRDAAKRLEPHGSALAPPLLRQADRLAEKARQVRARAQGPALRQMTFGVVLSHLLL
jgi:hypothetical protein